MVWVWPDTAPSAYLDAEVTPIPVEKDIMVISDVPMLLNPAAGRLWWNYLLVSFRADGFGGDSRGKLAWDHGFEPD